MSWTPNKIALITRGRYDEATAGGNIYPGMLLQNNGSEQVIAHSVIGGPPLPTVMVAEENALAGGDITQKSASSGEATPHRLAAKGDLLLMLLQNGQNVSANTPLISGGDGTLIASPGTELYNIVAPSTTITNTNTETVFSNGTYTFPANFLQVGDVIRVRAKVFCIAENSTNTHRIRMYLGSTTLADSTALQLAASDVVIIDLVLVVRTIGASGTFIADGVVTDSVSATFAQAPFTVASTTVDTTATEALTIKSLASAASTGNQIRLDEFTVRVDRGQSSFLIAAEAINNSGGTGTSGFNSAAFIRVKVQ